MIYNDDYHFKISHSTLLNIYADYLFNVNTSWYNMAAITLSLVIFLKILALVFKDGTFLYHPL